jgi:predicted lipid-binding transport protein (Tim44 family)
MSFERIALGFAAFAGLVALVKLIGRRQQQLTEILRGYVKQRMEWSRKKNRAAAIARLAADRKNNEEQLARAAAAVAPGNPISNSQAAPSPQAQPLQQS